MKKNKKEDGEFLAKFRKGFKGSDEDKERMELNEDQQERLKKKKKDKGLFSKIKSMLE